MLQVPDNSAATPETGAAGSYNSPPGAGLRRFTVWLRGLFRSSGKPGQGKQRLRSQLLRGGLAGLLAGAVASLFSAIVHQTELWRAAILAYATQIPAGWLLVSIRREGRSLAPLPDTALCAGDQLRVVLPGQDDGLAQSIRRQARPAG